ncbi:MAG: DNA polymerase III subunit beta, partial [Micromonosporaceae bacterium]
STAALVPARTLAETAKTLGGLGGEVTLSMSDGGLGEGLIGFSGGGRRSTSRLLNDDFPKVKSLLPDSYAAEAKINVGALTEVVKRVSLVAERTTPVRLSFSDDGLIVEAGGSDEARASEAMECEFSGEALTIAFNPAFLLDALGVLEHPVAVLSFNDPKKPAVMTGASSDGEVDGGYRHVLMPVRVGA